MYNKRQNEIIQYLTEVKFAKIEQLAERFQVSAETIRRDLMEFEKDSCVKRVRGGAVYNNLRGREIAFEKKLEGHQKEKTAIAHLAASYVQDEDALALGNGSGTIALARCLAREKNRLTVITNSPDIAYILNENSSNSVYMTSGRLRKHNRSIVGSLCTDCLDNFKVDKSIVCIDGVSRKDGITEYNTEEASAIKKMLEIGHTRIVLCEFSKFSEVAFHKVCDAEELDYIFTDWNISMKEVKAWSELDVKVVAASPEDGDSDFK